MQASQNLLVMPDMFGEFPKYLAMAAVKFNNLSGEKLQIYDEAQRVFGKPDN